MKKVLAKFANSVSICVYSSFFESALIDQREPVRKDLQAHIMFASIVDILIYVSSCEIQWLNVVHIECQLLNSV